MPLIFDGQILRTNGCIGFIVLSLPMDGSKLRLSAFQIRLVGDAMFHQSVKLEENTCGDLFLGATGKAGFLKQRRSAYRGYYR